MAENEMPETQSSFNDDDFYLVPKNLKIPQGLPASVIEDFAIAGPAKAGGKIEVGEWSGSAHVVGVLDGQVFVGGYVIEVRPGDAVTAPTFGIGNA
jgi:hypothetical protein